MSHPRLERCRIGMLGIASAIGMLMLSLNVDVFAGQLQQEKTTNQEANDIDQIISQALNNRASLRRLNCEFNVTTGTAASEEELISGKLTHVSGKAHGKWLVFDDTELFQFDVGDVFEIRPAGKDQPNTAYVPFPGGTATLRSNEYVLSLNHMIGSGIIGPAKTTFQGDTFHPRYCLGGFAADRYADPLQWLLDPPGPDEPQLTFDTEADIPEDWVRINMRASFSPKVTWQYDFDLGAGGLLSRVMTVDADHPNNNLYFVKEACQVGKNGPYIPKLAWLIFHTNGAGDFPKSVIRFEITKISDQIRAEDVVLLVDKNATYPVYTSDSPVLRSWLSQGDRISSSDLEPFYEKALRQKPWKETRHDDDGKNDESDLTEGNDSR